MGELQNFKINMEGDKELQAALKNIEVKVGRKVIRGAVRDAAKLVMREAKAGAPILGGDTRVGPGSQMPNPGTLRKGIRVHAGKRKKGHYRVNVDFKSRSAMGIPEESDHYAPMVIETGQSDSVKGRAFYRHGPREGAHFMIEAYAKKRGEADTIIVGKTRDGLIQFWKANTRRPK